MLRHVLGHICQLHMKMIPKQLGRWSVFLFQSDGLGWPFKMRHVWSIFVCTVFEQGDEILTLSSMEKNGRKQPCPICMR